MKALSTFVFFLFSFCTSQFLYAQDQNTHSSSLAATAEGPSSNSKVKWYLPELIGLTDQGRIKTQISGKTEASSVIYFKQNTVTLVDQDGKPKQISLQDILLGQNTVNADSDGLFLLQLKLPPGDVILPIEVKSPQSNQVQKFQLTLHVDKEQVKIETKEKLEQAPLADTRYGFWFGTGFNYSNYHQKSSTLGSDVNYESFKGPSFYTMLRARLSRKIQLYMSAETSPGATSSSDNIAVDSGNYNWNIFTTELAYVPSTQGHLFGYDSKLGVRGGLQYHVVPFVARESVNGTVTTAQIETNSIYLASFGFDCNIRLSPLWNSEIYMVYQYPLKTGDTFTLKSSVMFNGSIGVSRKFKNNFRLGVYWYGQSHQYKFASHDKILDADIDGDQSMLFSNLELRLGYEF